MPNPHRSNLRVARRALSGGFRGTVLWVALAGSATALPQLDLPKARRDTPPPAKPDDRPADPPAGSQGEGQTPPAGEGVTTPVIGPDGKVVGTKTTTRINGPGEPARRPSGPPTPSGAGFDLPDARRTAPSDAAPAPAPPGGGNPPASAPVLDPFAPIVPDAKGAARVLMTELRKVRRVTDDAIPQIADRLARLGSDGLEVGRFALAQADAPMVVVGARVLLSAGTADDADLVVRRLRGPIPRAAAGPVLDELMARDPSRGTNDLLTSLLGHDTAQVRRAARKALEPRLVPDDLDALARIMADRSSEKRRGALEMIARLGDDLSSDHMLAAVTDPSSSVAKVAISELSRSTAQAVDLELERALFARGVLGAPEARFLLAIVEREDRTGQGLLESTAVPLLLEGLDNPIPIVANASALALAGIGFRSDESGASDWLDGPVPSRLIGVVAGVEFFDGFDLVRDPAIRRLRQITGVTFGTDGAAWSGWWADNHFAFHATRARILVTPEDATRIVVTAHDPTLGGPVTLAGPGLAQADSTWTAPETGATYYLFPEDARDLLSFVGEQGVFGVERLPGARGTLGVGGKSLEVAIGNRRKLFRVADGYEQAWFASIVQRAYGLERRLGWQLCTVPGELETQRDVFLAELEAAGPTPDPAARRERIEDLVLRHLSAVEPIRRGPGIVALLDLDDQTDALGTDDVWPLAKLLEGERAFGDRAVDLVELGLRAAGLRPAPDPESAEPLDQATIDAGLLLMDTLEAAFGVYGISGIEDVLATLGREVVLEAARDTRDLRRMAAANLLQRSEPGSLDAAETRLLLELAYDDDADVRAAALRAIGTHPMDGARQLLEERAASSIVSDRAVAVEMLGRVGGASAMTLIVDALSAPDQRLHLPAARGLAALGTEDTAPLLVSLLRSTSSEAVRGVAREGLLALGSPARRELLIALRSTDERLRRSAALILAELLEPRVVSELARMLVEDPTDSTVEYELQVLTLVDYSDEASPGVSYMRFWEEAEQRDVLAWFFAGAARRGLRPPARIEFAGTGTANARAFCIAAQTSTDPIFAERALREFERMTGEAVGPVPEHGIARRRWFERASELVDDAPLEAPSLAPRGTSEPGEGR